MDSVTVFQIVLNIELAIIAFGLFSIASVIEELFDNKKTK